MPGGAAPAKSEKDIYERLKENIYVQRRERNYPAAESDSSGRCLRDCSGDTFVLGIIQLFFFEQRIIRCEGGLRVCLHWCEGMGMGRVEGTFLNNCNRRGDEKSTVVDGEGRDGIGKYLVVVRDASGGVLE